MTNLFNNIVTPGLVDPIEDRDTVDALKSGHAQLREVMKASYEPNKLKSQTEFNAICLAQLSSELVGDKTLVRVKARIPEIHCILPLPLGADDYNTISLYPTFQASAADFANEGITTDGAIVPGTKLVVSFDQMGNFRGGTLKKIFSWQETPAPGPGTTTPSTSPTTNPSGNPNSSPNATRPPNAGTTPLTSTSGTRSARRNTEALKKKYQFNTKLTSNNQITNALIDSWYELILLTRGKAGGGPINVTQADRDARRIGLDPTWDKKDKSKRIPGKWHFPTTKKGWGGKCWQFASAWLTIFNNILQEPHGKLPYSKGQPSQRPPLKKPNGRPSTAVYYLPNTNLSWMNGRYASKLPRVKTPNGRYLGAGCTYSDAAKLGLLPGMAVHTSVNWDHRPASNYGLLDAFHHWVVYVGYINGKHYFGDSKGIHPGSFFNRWHRRSWIWQSFNHSGGPGKYSYTKLREWLSKKYNWDVTAKGLITKEAFKALDSYSVNGLVRHIYTPFPMEDDT